MRKTVVLWVMALLVAIPALAACSSAANQSQPTPTPVASTPTPEASPTNSAPSGPATGLNLTLRLSSSEVQPGQELSVTVGEVNMLATENAVPAAGAWRMKGLAVGPCGTVNYPVGVAIFNGYYTASEVLTATPLQLYDPNATYHCPMILSSISGYDFHPLVDVTNVSGSCNSNPCLSDFRIRSVVTAKGYWSEGKQSTFSDFDPGIYTVAAGDEWGTLKVLHFTVNGP